MASAIRPFVLLNSDITAPRETGRDGPPRAVRCASGPYFTISLPRMPAAKWPGKLQM